MIGMDPVKYRRRIRTISSLPLLITMRAATWAEARPCSMSRKVCQGPA